MTAHELVVRTRWAVLPERPGPAAVVIDDGRIVAVHDDLDAPVDAAHEHRLAYDEALLPGLVDTHVHVNEPGRTEWEGFATATRAALAGGITTLIDMPLNSLPPTIDPDALAVKQDAAQGQCAIDVGFWGGAVPSNLGALAGLHEAGVFGFKCFLADSGVEEFPPLNPAQLEQHLAEIAALDALMIVHAEDAGVLDTAPQAEGRSYASFLASRPRQAENAAIATVLDAARRTGARVHVLHLSSAAALPMISAAKSDGVRVSVETCPHYLTLDAERVPSGATQYKCCPPIRDAENQDRLWQGLTEGVIDIVVSDHSPCLPELKHLEDGDFGTAWGGISSLQLGLPLIWTAARKRGIGVPEVVDWMATKPARQVGLQTKGVIAPGAAADLVVFAPDEEWVVDPATLQHRHPITPYAGHELVGVVRQVWLRGVATDGSVPAGQFLTRGGS